MTATALPLIPWLVFAVFEPMSLLGGFFGATGFPDWFVAEQVPRKFGTVGHLGGLGGLGDVVQGEAVVTANSRLVAMQLGNVYLLMAMVGIAVLSTTTEPKVVRNYLMALWVADISHIALTAHGMGIAKVRDVTGWNSLAWGNIGATGFLFFMRTAYLAGLFDLGGRAAAARMKGTKKAS